MGQARATLAIALLCAAARIVPVAAEEPPAPPAGVLDLVERAVAVAAKGGGAAAALFDRDALRERARAVFPRAEGQGGARLAIALAVSALVRQPDVLPAGSVRRVLRWEGPAAGRDGMLLLRSRESDGWLLYRLWLREGPSGWRLTDLENVESGVPLSLVLSTVMGGYVATGDPRLRAAYEALGEAVQLAAEERFREVAARLERPADAPRMPPVLEGLRSLLLGVATLEGSPETAAQHAAEAVASAPDLAFGHLLRARAYDGAQPLQAVEAAERFLAAVGDDPDGCELLADNLLALERSEAAVAVARRGLATDPEHPGLVWTLMRALPEGRRAEAGPALRALPGLPGRDTLGQLVDLDEPESEPVALLGVVRAALVDREPRSPWLPLLRAAEQVAAGRPDAALEAAALGLRRHLPPAARSDLRRLLERLPPDQGDPAFPVRILEAVPAGDRGRMFSALAYDRATERDVPGLRALIDRAHTLGGVGPDLPYYDVEIAWLEEDLPRMLELLERLHVPDPLPPDAHPILRTVLGYWPVELRVRGLVRLGRPAEALPFARRRYAEHNDALLLLIVHAAVEQPAVVERLFDHAVAGGADARRLADDVDVQPRLRDPAYAALLARHGITLPDRAR